MITFQLSTALGVLLGCWFLFVAVLRYSKVLPFKLTEEINHDTFWPALEGYCRLRNHKRAIKLCQAVENATTRAAGAIVAGALSGTVDSAYEQALARFESDWAQVVGENHTLHRTWILRSIDSAALVGLVTLVGTGWLTGFVVISWVASRVIHAMGERAADRARTEHPARVRAELLSLRTLLNA